MGHFTPATTCKHLQASSSHLKWGSQQISVTTVDMLASHHLAIISGTKGCPHHCSRNLRWNGHGSCLLIQQLEFSKPSTYRNDGQSHPRQAWKLSKSWGTMGKRSEHHLSVGFRAEIFFGDILGYSRYRASVNGGLHDEITSSSHPGRFLQMWGWWWEMDMIPVLRFLEHFLSSLYSRTLPDSL